MQLNKRAIKIIVISISLIMITNINPVHEVVVMLTSSNYYKYASKGGECTFMEAIQGRDMEMMKRWFKAYKETTGDTTLYRLFSKNPLAFWRYRDYVKDPRYNLPYKSWQEIEPTRHENFQDQSNWQEF